MSYVGVYAHWYNWHNTGWEIQVSALNHNASATRKEWRKEEEFPLLSVLIAILLSHQLPTATSVSISTPMDTLLREWFMSHMPTTS